MPLSPEFQEQAAPFRLAFIGGGINSAVGRVHYNALRMDGQFELVAGCFSRHKALNQESGRFYGVTPHRVYDTYQALLATETDLDMVVILTPTSNHLEPVLACLEAGLGVICEKAMSATPAEAAAIRMAEKQHGGFLAVTYNYTGYPALRELRARIRNGQLGRILHFIAEMPQEGFIRRGDDGQPAKPQEWRLHDGPIPTVYLDLGVHLHQITQYLIPRRPLQIQGIHHSYGNFPAVVDYVQAAVRYEDDMVGSFLFGKCMLGQRNGLRLRIFGSEGSAEWEQVRPEEIHLAYPDGRREILDRGGHAPIAGAPRYTRFKAGHPAGYVEAFANLYVDIAQAFREYRRHGHWQSEEVFDTAFAGAGLGFLQTMADAARSGRSEAIPD